MWGYLWPLLMIIASNVIYNITAKSTPASANPFLSLTVTYIIGAVFTVILYLVTAKNKNLALDLHALNWTSAFLGVAIVGLEVGYLYLYRAGWNISVGSICANIVLAIILIFVGVLLYKEHISVKQICGVVLCMAGLYLINQKK